MIWRDDEDCGGVGYVRFGVGECGAALLVAPLVIVPTTFAAHLALELGKCRWRLHPGWMSRFSAFA